MLAQAMELCLRGGKSLLAEAGTGTGKSMGYLIPLIIWALETGQKTLVSTFTKVLQKQLFDKDLPRLQKAIGGFEYALSLGGENYLCPKRFASIDETGLFNSEDHAITNRMHKWKKRHPLGINHDLDFPVPDSLWRKVCRDQHSCKGEVCPYRDSCGWLQAKKDQKNANILISNHHLVFYNIKLGGKLLPPVGAMVFDECHEVEKIAKAVMSIDVTSTRIKNVTTFLHNPTTGRGLIRKAAIPEDIKDAIIRDIAFIDRAVGTVRENLPAGDVIITGKDNLHVAKLTMGLAELGKKLAAVKDDTLAPYKDQVKEMAVCLSDINTQKIQYKKKNKGKDQEVEAETEIKCRNVYWSSNSGKGWKLTSSPIEVGGLLKATLFDAMSSVVMTSATMTINKDFKFFKRTIGANGNCETTWLSSPFDYKRQAVVYTPMGMPSHKDTAAYSQAVFAEACKLIEIFNGRTLILCTNKESMHDLHVRLKTAFPNMDFFQQGDKPSNILIEEFKESDSAVLMGTAAFWQGVDIEGDNLMCVIITKLPFDVPNDPVTIAQAQKIEAENGKGASFALLMLPKAILQFKQGFGRLIRTTEDKGVVAILDNRIYTKSYGSRFINSIPEGCRRVKDIRQIPKELLPSH